MSLSNFPLLVEENEKIHSFFRQYFFSLKLHKLPNFMFLSLFYDNIFFSLKQHNDPFFNVFQRFRKKIMFFSFNFHVLIKNKPNTLYFFFSLKLHKLPYSNLCIGFNNILNKIPFSCYVKCNTSNFNKKIYISFRKRIFLCFIFTFPCSD